MTTMTKPTMQAPNRIAHGPAKAPGRRRAASLPLLALLPLFAPCFSSAKKPHKPPARVAPTPPVQETSGAGTLLAAADDITRQVAALRGLEPKKPFAKGVLSREEIGKKLKERIAKEYTPDEIRTESRVLKRLGLLPPDVDYQQLLFDLLMEQVAGFYDPFARELYIADWLSLELQRPAMAHEIEHALQDQHFDLKTFATPIKDDSDRQLARSALVEGDGTAVMQEFGAQAHGLDLSLVPNLTEALGRQLASGAMSQWPMFNRAPRFLRETLLFPYFSGMSFVMALRKGQPGWSKVDLAFRVPPESTEQVLHPEKYLAKEHPVAIVAAPLSSLAPQKELRHDVLGELGLRVLFASKLSDAVAEKAAAGWGGDRLAAYGESGEGDAAKPVAVIDRSVWDTEEDAKQAESAMRGMLSKQTGKPEPQAGAGSQADAGAGAGVAVFEIAGEAWSVERREKEMVVLFGVPSAARAEVSEEVWAKWKVGGAEEKKAK